MILQNNQNSNIGQKTLFVQCEPIRLKSTLKTEQTKFVQSRLAKYGLCSFLLRNQSFGLFKRDNIIQYKAKAKLKLKMQFFFVYILSALLYFTHSENKSQQVKHWIPKIIWTWWDKQINNSNHQLKIFEFNHLAYAKGWEIRQLDPSNQYEWLNEVPDYNNILDSVYFQNAGAKRKSELVRLILLKHFGGLYIDLTVILTESLDWLLDIENQKYISNKFGDFPDVLLTHDTIKGSKQLVKNQNYQDVLILPTFENTFIASKPNTEFIQKWKLSYFKYGNDLSKSFALEVTYQNSINIYDKNSAHQQQAICAQAILKMKQNQLDKVWDKQNKKPRKFAVNHYKIWTIDISKNLILNQGQIQNDLILDKLFKTTIKKNIFQRQFPKYFMKLNSLVRTSFNNYFLNEESIKKAKCPIQNYILEDSIAYQYLLKDYPFKFYSNPVVKNANEIDCQNIKLLNSQQTQKLKFIIFQQVIKNIKNNNPLNKVKQQLNDLIQQITLLQNKSLTSNRDFQKQSKDQQYKIDNISSQLQEMISMQLKKIKSLKKKAAH